MTPPGFTHLDLRPDMDRAPWDHINHDTALAGELESIGLLRNGTSQGRAVAALLVRLPDGRHVVVQTTWRLFTNAARALASSPIATEEI